MSDETPGGIAYPKRPWMTLWTRPRATIRAIANSEPNRHVLWLVILASFFNRLSGLVDGGEGDDTDIETILIAAGATAVVGGVVWLYVLSWFSHWVGRWFGGVASVDQLRAATAWPNVVWIAVGAIWIPVMIVYGREPLMSDSTSPVLHGIFWAGVALDSIAWLAFMALTLICVREVQRFSVWKAAANVLVSAALIAAPLGLLVIFPGVGSTQLSDLIVPLRSR